MRYTHRTQGNESGQPVNTQEFQYRPGPNVTRERRSHVEVAEHLKRNPGVWALIRTAPNNQAAASAAFQIRQGVRAAFRPAGHYDAYSHGTEVIARYIGGEK